MKEFLKEHLKSISEFNDEWTSWEYSEDVNEDANTDAWLENRTSYVYKVGVLCAIDSNKLDWIYAAIGTQRKDGSGFEIKGTFHFERGENDDVGRVIKRALDCMKFINPIFEEA